MRWLKWILLAMAAVLLVFAPHFTRRYTVFILYLVCVNTALAQSWNLLGGYTGLVSLGHAAFFGLGAYTTAMMISQLNLPFYIAAIAGGVVAAAFSAAISIPTFRFRGIYFAIGTLVLSEALRIWMINWESTGGAQGIHLPPGSGTSLKGFYYIMLVIAAGTTVLLSCVLRTKLGLGLRAIRDNEDSAMNMGVNTFRTKLYAFLISAFIAGLTGGIHATKMSTIEPYSIFSAAWTFAAINIVIIGGMGTVSGPILGAVFITYLSDYLAEYHTFHLVITGIILILIIRFLPAGIWGQICKARVVKRVTGFLES
ncbi:MAG: branched-chain amino acid ABC transporter permease [Deltaproteobacteria bacterium]|nr:branched-chain amino acid ABC transporter permease [Deltaproteobacteria bacterium]